MGGWPDELEKEWRLLLSELEEADNGFLVVEYDRPFTRDALRRRLRAECRRRGWSLLEHALKDGRSLARLERGIRSSPVRVALLALPEAAPEMFRALNLARERLYEQGTVFIFLVSAEEHGELLRRAHDLMTWTAPPFTFALPEVDIPALPPPTAGAEAEQIEYYRERIHQALDENAWQTAYDLLPPLADLYLAAGMYEPAQELYRTLARYHENRGDENQAVAFTRRADIARGWQILRGLEAGRLSPDERLFLRRLFDDGYLRVQFTEEGEPQVVDEMGGEASAPRALYLTIKALSEEAAMTDSKYDIHIDHAEGLAIGDGAQVTVGQPTPDDTLTRALARARRILAILEEQAAGYTSLTIPAHLKLELEDKRREVQELERRLKEVM